MSFLHIREDLIFILDVWGRTIKKKKLQFEHIQNVLQNKFIYYLQLGQIKLIIRLSSSPTPEKLTNKKIGAGISKSGFFFMSVSSIEIL